MLHVLGPQPRFGIRADARDGPSEQLLPPREVFHFLAVRLAVRRLWNFGAIRDRRRWGADFFNFHGTGCGHRWRCWFHCELPGVSRREVA